MAEGDVAIVFTDGAEKDMVGDFLDDRENFDEFTHADDFDGALGAANDGPTSQWQKDMDTNLRIVNLTRSVMQMRIKQTRIFAIFMFLVAVCIVLLAAAAIRDMTFAGPLGGYAGPIGSSGTNGANGTGKEGGTGATGATGAPGKAVNGSNGAPGASGKAVNGTAGKSYAADGKLETNGSVQISGSAVQIKGDTSINGSLVVSGTLTASGLVTESRTCEFTSLPLPDTPCKFAGYGCIGIAADMELVDVTVLYTANAAPSGTGTYLIHVGTSTMPIQKSNFVSRDTFEYRNASSAAGVFPPVTTFTAPTQWTQNEPVCVWGVVTGTVVNTDRLVLSIALRRR